MGRARIHHILRKALAAALLAFGVLATNAAPAAATTSASGFPVKKCISMGSALEAPREGEWGYTIRAYDFARIKGAGFDTVRIPIAIAAHTAETAPYAIDPALLKRMDQLIGWANFYRLNVIIDLHHYYAIHGDPKGQTPRLIAIWTQLAERYKDQSDNVIFELLNEPQGPKMNPLAVQRIHAALIPAVRKINPTRWLVVAGPRYGTVQGLVGWTPPKDPRVVTGISFYYPMNFTHQNAHFAKKPVAFGRAWGTKKDFSALRLRVDAAAVWASLNNAPMFVTEFGVYNDNPTDQRAAWLTEARRAFEGANMSWCAWDYAGSFSLYDVKTESWDAPLRDALTKPLDVETIKVAQAEPAKAATRK